MLDLKRYLLFVQLIRDYLLINTDPPSMYNQQTKDISKCSKVIYLFSQKYFSSVSYLISLFSSSLSGSFAIAISSSLCSSSFNASVFISTVTAVVPEAAVQHCNGWRIRIGRKLYHIIKFMPNRSRKNPQ